MILANPAQESVQNTCGTSGARPEPHQGCMTLDVASPGVIRAASGVVAQVETGFVNVPSHELGHGLLGAAHLGLSPPANVGDTFAWFSPLMGSLPLVGVGTPLRGTFAPYEVDAIRAV